MARWRAGVAVLARQRCPTQSGDTIGAIASGSSGEGIVWASFLALVFLVPCALVLSGTSAAFPAEGGRHHRVELASGRARATVAVVLCWTTDPIWLGGSLAFSPLPRATPG